MQIIETNYGKMRGVDMGDYIEYRGVPYAKPPVGELRWKAPRKPDRWEGVYEADTYAARCMQEVQQDPLYCKEFYADTAFDRVSSEDCLYLNIWTPKEGGGSHPVAFWIHGGAFLGGYATEQEFDGEAYCRRGVILVSVEYRCNIFGFLAHPWLGAENERGLSGNYGILDQIAALTWVYENIRAFGGDPDNITVFGQSAGAMSVQTLISSPLTKGMIARAILQSGGGYGNGLNRDDMTLAFQEELGESFVKAAGADSLRRLRELTAEEVLALMPAFFEAAMPKAKGLFLVPTIDGYVLEDGCNALIDQRKIKDIPYLLGCTADDIFVTPEIKEQGQRGPLYDVCLEFCRKRSEAGKENTWMYYFARKLPGDDAGAFHSSELWYMFGTLGRCWRPMSEADHALSEKMLDYWTNFMRYGNPNGEGEESWKPCSGESGQVMVLDV